jgi:hypothetical protein
VSWIRAAITGVLVVAVAFLLLVVVPDQILGLTSMERGTKVLLATSVFVVSLAALLAALRRLQQRHLL